jgi:hypothetical protein
MNSLDPEFEIGHILLINIVGYSKFPISERGEQIHKLNEIAHGAEQICLVPYFTITAAWTGEKELALQQLETGLRAPMASDLLSHGALKLVRFWDPPRGDPRFEKSLSHLFPK